MCFFVVHGLACRRRVALAHGLEASAENRAYRDLRWL